MMYSHILRKSNIIVSQIFCFQWKMSNFINTLYGQKNKKITVWI